MFTVEDYISNKENYQDCAKLLKSQLSSALCGLSKTFLQSFINSDINCVINIPSSTSGVFTLFLSIFILKTRPDVLNFLAVLLSFGGISMIALADTESQEETVVGDFLAFI